MNAHRHTQAAHDAREARDARGNARVTVSVNVSVNGERREFAPGTTLDSVVRSLTPAPSGVAAALNETVVPRAQWPSTALRDGDRVEVLTAVQGG